MRRGLDGQVICVVCSSVNPEFISGFFLCQLFVFLVFLCYNDAD